MTGICKIMMEWTKCSSATVPVNERAVLIYKIKRSWEQYISERNGGILYLQGQSLKLKILKSS